MVIKPLSGGRGHLLAVATRVLLLLSPLLSGYQALYTLKACLQGERVTLVLGLP